MAYVTKTEWNEAKIISCINEMVNKTGNNQMPTHSEMDKFYGNYCLSNAVRRHGGTKYFANKMGLEIKNCESKFGEDFELRCINDIMLKLNLEAEKMQIRYPYDVLVENSVKIDVKSCTGKQYYSFNLEKAHQTCDIFVFYCIKNDEVEKIYIVPSSVLCGKTQFAVGMNSSKYDKYLNRWDIIKHYNDFMHEEL